MAADENGLKLPRRTTIALALRLLAAVCVVVLGLVQDGAIRVVLVVAGVALFAASVWLAFQRPAGDRR